jgi:AbrB family looped-hinge helix DNA binding protein
MSKMSKKQNHIVKARKVGDSIVVTLPKQTRESVPIAAGDRLVVSAVPGKSVVIVPVSVDVRA